MSVPIYSDILARNYGDYLWSTKGNDYNNITWDPSNSIGKPSQATLDDEWPAVEAVIQADQAEAQKIAEFQVVYSLHDQSIIIARAVQTADHTDLDAMLEFWDTL